MRCCSCPAQTCVRECQLIMTVWDANSFPRYDCRLHHALTVSPHPQHRASLWRVQPFVAVSNPKVCTQGVDIQWDLPERVSAIDDDHDTIPTGTRRNGAARAVATAIGQKLLHVTDQGVARLRLFVRPLAQSIRSTRVLLRSFITILKQNTAHGHQSLPYIHTCIHTSHTSCIHHTAHE